MSEPPNINITQRRINLLHAGYAPLPVSGKAPSLDQWQTKIEVSPDEIMSWGSLYSSAPSTGLLTKLMPTFDVDVLVPEAATAVEELIRARFGNRGCILVRVGLAPKRAIPFRTDTPFPKITANVIAPDGSTGQKIEFLGDGQQVVAFGIHPDTGEQYQWHGGEPGECKYWALPNITEIEARALVDDALRLLCDQHGYQRTPPRSANGGGTSEDWSYLVGNISEGHVLHDSIRDLAAKMIVSGMSGGAATNLLRGLMDASPAPRDQRWQERYDDIPRAVMTAEEKFTAKAEQPTAPVLRSYFAEELEQQPVEPVDWVVPDFIPSGAVTGFFGDGGTGKDLLLFMLGTSAICGSSWLGHTVKPSRVLYFPVEDDDKELRRRLAAIADHNGIRFADFPNQFKITPLVGKDTVLAAFDQKSGVVKPTPLYTTIRRDIEDFKPTLVIVGNRVNIFGVNQNDDAQARQCMQLLSAIALDYETAVIMPGHVSVAGIASNVGTSGSVQWSNACRSRLFLSRIQVKGDDEPDPDARLLEVRKANWGPTNRLIRIRWSEGVFVVDTDAVPTFVEVQAATEADKEFMRMLDLYSIEKVSLRPTANNYAPKVFSEDIRCKLKARSGKKALTAAMERLLTKGAIATAVYGPPSNQHECIVQAFPNAQGGPE